ncbi:MAG TPA: LysR family transcriptional regulator, partial [Kiloniellaceae bacterium]|nr:LysR family transcriptional regulator [Kiloniellaceae bacterium]
MDHLARRDGDVVPGLEGKAGHQDRTQAAVSQQVKVLEMKLGAALFKRLPRGLELSEAGQA